MRPAPTGRRFRAPPRWGGRQLAMSPLRARGFRPWLLSPAPLGRGGVRDREGGRRGGWGASRPRGGGDKSGGGTPWKIGPGSQKAPRPNGAALSSAAPWGGRAFGHVAAEVRGLPPRAIIARPVGAVGRS